MTIFKTYNAYDDPMHISIGDIIQDKESKSVIVSFTDELIYTSDNQIWLILRHTNEWLISSITKACIETLKKTDYSTLIKIMPWIELNTFQDRIYTYQLASTSESRIRAAKEQILHYVLLLAKLSRDKVLELKSYDLSLVMHDLESSLLCIYDNNSNTVIAGSCLDKFLEMYAKGELR